jgi:hypothetical protein
MPHAHPRSVVSPAPSSPPAGPDRRPRAGGALASRGRPHEQSAKANEVSFSGVESSSYVMDGSRGRAALAPGSNPDGVGSSSRARLRVAQSVFRPDSSVGWASVGTTLIPHALRVAPVAHAPDANEVTGEWRGRVGGEGGQLAERRGGHDRPKRQPVRSRATPLLAGHVEEPPQRDGLLVAEVIDTADPRPDDRRLGGPQEVGCRYELSTTGVVAVPSVRSKSSLSSARRVRAWTETGSRSRRPVAGSSLDVGPSTCGNETRIRRATRASSAAETRWSNQRVLVSGRKVWTGAGAAEPPSGVDGHLRGHAAPGRPTRDGRAAASVMKPPAGGRGGQNPPS